MVKKIVVLVFLSVFSMTFCLAELIKTEENGRVVYRNVCKTRRKTLTEIGKSPKTFSPSLNKTKYRHYIDNYSTYYGVNPILIRAIIQTESDFNPYAVSSKGAMGLMQLMPETAEHYNVKDPFEPGENILAGIKHICVLRERYNNNLPLMLAAYNAGDSAVLKYGGVPPFEETKKYIEKVLNLYDMNRNSKAVKTIYSKKNEKGKIVYSNKIIKKQ